MQRVDGRLVYSPSDLIRYLESPYSTWMDRFYLEYPGKLKPDDASEEQRLIAATGDKHERTFLNGLAGRGSVTTIERSKRSTAETIEAINRGDDIIYQAHLELDPFRGYADFLKRCGTGEKGQPLYEIWDTKLARKTKPYYLVQLCCYAEMLAAVQGVLPPTVRIVLGSGEMPAYATSDFYYYYLQLKEGFLRLMEKFDPQQPPEPDPRADHGRWSSHAQNWLDEKDHLVQVAGINGSQIKKLHLADITTVEQLAKLRSTKIVRLSDDILQRLVEQARLQVETRELRRKKGPDVFVPPFYKVLLPPHADPRRGLALLPPASDGDVFFDMEGYPLAERGLEYLFGASTRGRKGDLDFHDWWANDDLTEKTAFEGFIDWAHARWKADPSMHIYHYAQYEVTAARRLMGKHGTREDQVDDLLRNEVFVDLYQIVKQGLRVGEPSYSIKFIEHLYRGKRTGAVASAGQSIVYYANWIETGESTDWHQSPILSKIRDYNRDDCESTVQLYDWLLARQAEAKVTYLPKPAKGLPEERDAEIEEKIQAQRDLIQKLERKISTEKDAEMKRVHTLFLHLLEFHRREEKPVWWKLFSRMAAEPDELKDDLDCIGNAHLQPAKTEQVKKSKVFTYSFDPNQDTKIHVGNRVYATPRPDATFEVTHLDEEGVVKVKIGDKSLGEVFQGVVPPITSFVPQEAVSPAAMRMAVQEIVSEWAHTARAPACLLNFLRRDPPNIPGVKGPLMRQDETIEAAAIRSALAMRDSTLCLQGPPGTGKTTTAAAMIVALVKAGRTVGITSNSHKAIENLLRACCDKGGHTFRAIKVGGDSSIADDCPQVTHTAQTKESFDAFKDGVIGGTAWLFSRPEWAGNLDYLFIDEAGQVSLGNLVAVSRAATNLVLLGDQMQLEQPTQGHHPGESGKSALSYYLQDHATIPETLGLFLPVTHRLQPEICRFVSEMIYEGRLQPAPGNQKRRIAFNPAAKTTLCPEAGLFFLSVSHEGNVQSSEEELVMIRTLTHELIGREKIDGNGKPVGKVTLEDIIIVAPYNMQVRRIRDNLSGVRVGSVDKFQGQEADIVIVSMCSSYGEYGSRGLEFILDQNRMNVAISRARTLAVVVGDPRIAGASANSIAAMRRLNLYCRLVQDNRAP
jgi:predicted RecB family nuclease